ncbi:MAG: NADH-quinone oxidoreductase subunit D [Chloroflexi bacterium]|nr:NADH-quinone oxidoreductase subunit D [Chloroflexota bacterium]
MSQQEEVLATEPMILNMGPHHPSTHGVFRMRVALEGEVIVDMEPVFGYLHRGIEKLAEAKTYVQVVTLTDRQDYVAAMTNNLAYVMAVEKLAGIPVPERAEYIRVIMAELMRIASHLVAIGFFLNDLGVFQTVLLYTFRERERILDLLEMASGQRINFSYMRPGGVVQDLPPEFIPRLRELLRELPGYFDEYEQLINENEIVLARTKELGVLPAAKAVNASASGPVLRGSGVPFDLRKADPYSVYPRFQFDVPTGSIGDAYDRYLVRVAEMRQSVRILEQAVATLPAGPHRTRTPWLVRPPVGEAYAHIESPKGMLGVYLVSDTGISPYRYKVRPPSLINLTTLRDLVIGCKVADCIVVFGSIDINMGEVDR